MAFQRRCFFGTVTHRRSYERARCPHRRSVFRAPALPTRGSALRCRAPQDHLKHGRCEEADEVAPRSDSRSRRSRRPRRTWAGRPSARHGFVSHNGARGKLVLRMPVHTISGESRCPLATVRSPSTTEPSCRASTQQRVDTSRRRPEAPRSFRRKQPEPITNVPSLRALPDSPKVGPRRGDVRASDAVPFVDRRGTRRTIWIGRRPAFPRPPPAGRRATSPG